MLVVGFLFILDFPLRKPGLKTIITLSLVLVLTVGVIFAYTRFRVPAPSDEGNPIVEEIEILRNILYSGVWMRYDAAMQKKKQKKEEEKQQ